MSAKSVLHENMPKDADGCSVRSHKCENPNRHDMENGRDGKSSTEVRSECKRCSVCMMVLCEWHTKDIRHMEDCGFRSNQERQLLEEQRAKEAKEKQEKAEDVRRVAKVKAEFEEKEKYRRECIEERNRKVREGR